MANTVIEAPDTPETTPAVQNDGNVVPESPQDSKPTAEPETPPEVTPAPDAPPDPEVEIGGEKLSAKQILEWKEKYGRDSKWVQQNEARAAELNRQEEELRQLRLLKPYLEQRPDVLQQLILPKQERNYDQELQNLYNNKPDPNIYPNEYLQWELQKDLLRDERAIYLSEKKAEARLQQQYSQAENMKIETDARAKYLSNGVVSQPEYTKMTEWIFQNVQPRNGVYPKESYDVAFKILYEDKFLSQIKLDTAKKQVAPLLRTTNPQDNGTHKPRVAKTDDDIKDDAFISAMKERQKG